MIIYTAQTKYPHAKACSHCWTKGWEKCNNELYSEMVNHRRINIDNQIHNLSDSHITYNIWTTPLEDLTVK